MQNFKTVKLLSLKPVLWLLAALVCSPGMLSVAQAQPEPAAETTPRVLQAMPVAEVYQRCQQWVKQTAPEKLADWEQRFPAAEQSSLLPDLLLIETVRLVDEPAGKLLDQIAQASYFEVPFLLEEHSLQIEEGWFQTNARLWLGLELSQRQLYEEALEQFADLEATQLIDPAGYYFHRAVCEHHLLLTTEAAASLQSLLTECRPLPQRYRTVGELMQQDLARLEDKSLNEVSRKMRDVERRLDLGRSGQKVQKLEREIIESLDELITKLEQQAGGGGSGGGQGQNSQPGGQAQGPGQRGGSLPDNVAEVAGRKDGWGSLPPKEKAQAKQILGTMFPPHYQRAIEAYNKKSAQRENPGP